MDYEATVEWDEALWRRAEPVYREAFPEHGRKTFAVVRRMFERKLSALHALSDRGEVVAMALTAFDDASRTLIVDYIAVSEARRGQGLGRELLARIREWALSVRPDCRGMIIEVEAEGTPDNAARIRFWERLGFRLTDYVKSYVWVPETYRAMALSFDESAPPVEDGERLFKAITRYHEKAYRR